jgi:predicted transcriptional regulator
VRLRGRSESNILQGDISSVLFQRKPLPPREAQIAAIVYRWKEATANDVCEGLDGEISNAAVRSMLQRLIAKQILCRRRRGHCYYYAPAKGWQPDPQEALRQVVEEHFGGCFVQVQRELTLLLDGPAKGD